MRKWIAKMRLLKVKKWNKLTSGEKVLRVAMTVLKWAAIIALVVTLFAGLMTVVVGIIVGLGIMSAVGGGFTNASRAYRPGDRYVRFW